MEIGLLTRSVLVEKSPFFFVQSKLSDTIYYVRKFISEEDFKTNFSGSYYIYTELYLILNRHDNTPQHIALRISETTKIK